MNEPWVSEEEGVGVDVAFSPRIAWWVEQSLGLEATGTWKDWTVVRVNVGDEEGFVSWVLGFGEDAVVRSPQRVRDRVVKRLTESASSAPSGEAEATGAREGAQGDEPEGEDVGSSSDAARRSLSRLERILLLVPYCVAHPGVTITELAKRFGAPEKEIMEDLNLLFVCGLPDYTPADLIEVSLEEDQVYIRMADYFARPLRLTRTEAIPLYLKAQALVNLLQGTQDGRSGLKELASLRSALEKLGKALLPQEGGVAELTKRIKVQLESGEAKWLALLREAVTERSGSTWSTTPTRATT